MRKIFGLLIIMLIVQTAPPTMDISDAVADQPCLTADGRPGTCDYACGWVCSPLPPTFHPSVKAAAHAVVKAAGGATLGLGAVKAFVDCPPVLTICKVITGLGWAGGVITFTAAVVYNDPPDENYQEYVSIDWSTVNPPWVSTDDWLLDNAVNEVMYAAYIIAALDQCSGTSANRAYSAGQALHLYWYEQQSNLARQCTALIGDWLEPERWQYLADVIEGGIDGIDRNMHVTGDQMAYLQWRWTCCWDDVETGIYYWAELAGMDVTRVPEAIALASIPSGQIAISTLIRRMLPSLYTARDRFQ